MPIFGTYLANDASTYVIISGDPTGGHIDIFMRDYANAPALTAGAATPLTTGREVFSLNVPGAGRYRMDAVGCVDVFDRATKKTRDRDTDEADVVYDLEPGDYLLTLWC